MIKKYQHISGPLLNIGPQIRAAKQAVFLKQKDNNSAAVFDSFKKDELIPKKQTGGLIPKFEKPAGKLKKVNTLHGGIYVDETGAMYRTRSPLMGLPGIQYERIANPGLDYVYTDLGGRHRITSTGKYSHVSSKEGAKLRSMSKEAQEKEVSNLKNSKRLTRRGTYYNKLLQDGRWYHDLGNGRIDVANSDGTNTAYYMGSNGKYVIGTGPASPTDKPVLPTTTGGRRSRGTSGKVSGSKPVSTQTLPANQNPRIRRGTTSGADRTTTLPPVGTASPTDLSTMNDDWLKARNDAMTRGYRDYFFNGLRYSFTGEDLTNAQNNWRINRGKLNSGVKGLLGITNPTVIKLPVIEDKSIQKTDPIVEKNYGSGVTDTNLKLGTDQLYYPSFTEDEALRSAFKNKGLNFDDFKWLQSDVLPIVTSPVSLEVKNFKVNPSPITPLDRSERILKMVDFNEKLIPLPKARKGTKLIKRK